ncbi:hypothetical protein GCM10027416_28710 [Okibacterium endophyticum]
MDVWGSVAEWVTALVTLGALAAAVGAGLTTRRLYLIESERDRLGAEERSRRQAQNVAAWVAAAIDGGDAPDSYGVVIHNSSSAVIYDVSVRATRKGGGELELLKLHVVPPGEYYAEYQPGAKFAWGFPSAVSATGMEIRPVTKSAAMGIKRLEFRDSADRRWLRSDSGSLESVTAS